MAIVNRSQQSSQTFGGFEGFGQKSSGLTVDDLLLAAKEQGGAVAEVAEELSHPKRSMLSTMGDGFKNAFGTFVDVISAPNQMVAGMISKDVTVAQALKDNIEVSEVLLGPDRKDLDTSAKVGSFLTRTAIDVLFDPLTYVTFGAGRGVLGLSKSTAAIAGPGTASALKLRNVGDKFFLNAQADELIQRAIKKGDLTDEVGVKFASEVADAQTKGFHAEWVKKTRPKVMDEIEEAGEELTDENIIKRLLAKEDEAADFIDAQTMSRRLSPEYAIEAMSNLIEKNPALIETLVDKGGIKFFGKSVLSGQRIRSTSKIIPGMTLLDNATQPARNGLGALFSRNYTVDGRLPDDFIRIDQKFRDLADSMNSETLRRATSLFREMNVTAEEAKMITAAIESSVRPADKKLAAIWDSLKGIKPNPDIIRPEVLKAAGFTQDQLKGNLKLLREAGVPVSNFANYFPHMLVKQPTKSIPFRLPPSQSINAAKFAKFSAFIDDKGNRIVGFADKTDDGFKVATKEGDVVLKETDKASEFITDNMETVSRARATVAEAKEFGVDFEDNALVGMLVGSLEANKAAVTRTFLREAGEKMGVVASKAPNGYRPVAVTGLKFEGSDLATNLVSQQGEQLFFHPQVADRLENFMGSLASDEATEKLMQNYDKIQNLFKATVTSIFPAFHGRNAISNVMLHFLDIGAHSLNPANHVASANLINLERQFGKLQLAVDAGKKSADDLFEFNSKVIMKDRTGYEWSFGELRKVIKDNVVAFNPRNLGQIDQAQFARGDIDDISRALFPDGKNDKIKNAVRTVNPFSVKNKLIESGFKVGSLVEDQARLVDFMVNLRATGDVQLAAERTKMFLFDYQNLSEFERRFMRRIIPFYTFSRKNLELQVKTLFSKPGRIAGEIRAIQTIGDAFGDGNLSDEDKEKLPEWMQDGLNAVIAKEGSHVTVLSSIGSPIEQVFQQAKANQALASVSPILRLPVELMSGYSFFHGKSISEVTNAAAFKSAPAAVKDFIGFQEVNGTTKDGEEFTYYAAMRPSRMHAILNMPPTARVLSSLKQMQNQDVSEQYRALQFLVGLRPFEFDLEVEAARREKELQKELEGVLDTAGVGYSFSRFVVPDEDKDFESF